MIKNPCYEPKNDSIFAETVNTKFQTFSIKNKYENVVKEFTLSIIDSPGTFEIRSNDDTLKARTDEEITRMIGQCLDNEITHLHVIVMFCTFEVGISTEDIESIKLFLQMFGGSGVTICLCVTRADRHNPEWRAQRKTEIMKHDELASLITENNMKVMFMGCVDIKGVPFREKDDLHDAYVDTYEMRKELLTMIFEANTRTQLSDMNVLAGKVASVKEKLHQTSDNFIKFLTISDWDLSSVENMLMSHQHALNFITDNKSVLAVPALSEQYATFLISSRKFNTEFKGPNDIKSKILCSLVI